MPTIAHVLAAALALVLAAAPVDGSERLLAPRMTAGLDVAARSSVATPPTGAVVADAPDALRGSLDWPVPRARVLRAFVPPASAWGAGHRGIDVAATPGTTVVAGVAGTVAFAGDVVDRGVVTIRMADAPWEVLVTVEPVAPSVAAGDVVAAGDAIGTLAGGHRPCGACVHLGVRIDDRYANPMALLGAEHAVLLPLREPPQGAWRPRVLTPVGEDARGCAERSDAASRSSDTCVEGCVVAQASVYARGCAERYDAASRSSDTCV